MNPVAAAPRMARTRQGVLVAFAQRGEKNVKPALTCGAYKVAGTMNLSMTIRDASGVRARCTNNLMLSCGYRRRPDRFAGADAQVSAGIFSDCMLGSGGRTEWPGNPSHRVTWRPQLYRHRGAKFHGIAPKLISSGP